jgi:hypothetical protein
MVGALNIKVCCLLYKNRLVIWENRDSEVGLFP